MKNNKDWHPAGQGWEGQESMLQLMGWEKSRRVVVLRKQISKDVVALSEGENAGQLEIDFCQINGKTRVYEYAVLVTSLQDEILGIAQ